MRESSDVKVSDLRESKGGHFSGANNSAGRKISSVLSDQIRNNLLSLIYRYTGQIDYFYIV